MALDLKAKKISHKRKWKREPFSTFVQANNNWLFCNHNNSWCPLAFTVLSLIHLIAFAHPSVILCIPHSLFCLTLFIRLGLLPCVLAIKFFFNYIIVFIGYYALKSICGCTHYWLTLLSGSTIILCAKFNLILTLADSTDPRYFFVYSCTLDNVFFWDLLK